MQAGGDREGRVLEAGVEVAERIENNVARARIQRIRDFYAALTPDTAAYFVPDRPAESMGVCYSTWSILFTTATMVCAINSVLGASIAAFILILGVNASTTIAVPLRVAVGLASISTAVIYQRRRFIQPASID